MFEKSNQRDQIEVSSEDTTFNVIKREMIKDKLAFISFVFIIFLVVMIFIVSLIADSTEAFQNNFNFDEWNLPPSFRHVLGTDGLGRNRIILLIFAARNTLMVVASIVVISSVLGIIYGLISGYIGGFVDSVMMRIIECLVVFPNFVVIIVVIIISGGFTIPLFIITTSLLTWMPIATVVRTRVRQEKELEYIQASRTLGTSHFKIIFHQLLPNLSTVIIASITLNAVSITGIETGFTFLFSRFGFLAHIFSPSLGTLIASTGTMIVLRFYPLEWLPAVVLIVLIMFSINNIGEMLSRAADPRQRHG